MRPKWLQRRTVGQGGKFHSRWCFYRAGHVHPLCPPGSIAEQCAICRPRQHAKCATAARQRACTLCVERAVQAVNWYQSTAEARTAQRLDDMLAHGEIRAWRRAKRVVLQAAVGKQKAVTYAPDFVVQFAHEQRVWEVKGSQAVVADDALLKIKWYRGIAPTRGWPPLDVVTASGRELDV